MSFQQQNSRDMEKPGLDCATQTDAKPFSIRNYVSMSRQKNIAQSWPFSDNYLKLCLNHGITNVLPPLETRTFTSNGLHGRSVTNFSLNNKKTREVGKKHAIQKHKTEKKSKHGEDYSSLYNTINHLCGKLARLSLSFDGDSFLGQSSYKLQNTSNDDMDYKRAKRKGRRTKKKSLAEILAVAKRCVLDSHGRIRVSDGGSEKSQAQNAVVQRERKSGHGSKASKPKEDCSLIKKHQRHNDCVAGMIQLSKRSRTMGVSNYRYNEGKFKSWGRNDSCKTDETEKSG